MLLVQLSLIPVFVKAPRSMSYSAFSPGGVDYFVRVAMALGCTSYRLGSDYVGCLGLATMTILTIAFVTLALPRIAAAATLKH